MRVLGVFAKHWTPGRVKTRLAASIGESAAANVYLELLRATLHRFENLADRRILVYAPAEQRRDFAELAGEAWETRPQSSGDLGERMRTFFEQVLSPETQAVLIGSDSPALPAAIIERAFTALEQAAVALGPSLDGGYYLVGARDSVPPIFDGIPWSTEHVWSMTVDRLEKSQIVYQILDLLRDVDHQGDLRALLAGIEADPQADASLLRLHREVGRILG